MPIYSDNNERVKYRYLPIGIMSEDPKPEEDQERVNAQPTDNKTGDCEDLKKDTFDDESHVLKWELKIRHDGKTKTKYWNAISKDGVREYVVEPHLPFLAMLTHKF